MISSLYILQAQYVLAEEAMPKSIKPQPAPVQKGPLDAVSFGQFVRARRTQAGLGMHEAAAFCGIAVDTLTKIEKARGDVQFSSVLTVCRMLGINLVVEPWESP
jgi:ribosome-binding protein aMBF1 (putative translation factor)